MTHTEVLSRIYANALTKAIEKDYIPDGLDGYLVGAINAIAQRSESNKGIVTVLTTLLTHKLVEPMQDIRYHQAGMDGGFAGRGIDQSYVTPFMKNVRFPAMSESGWLTRSLEQAAPYSLDYAGRITPVAVKAAFLGIIDRVQVHGVSAESVLLYFFVCLAKQRDRINLELAKPHSLSISAIVALLEKHFTVKYSGSGASRLPTLALYAAYECMMSEVFRYKGKYLCNLESHTSADKQSVRIGDIDVNNEDGSAFEGVEIKHGIAISRQTVADAYEKFKIYNTDRYYLLTTADMNNVDWTEINKEIAKIANIHGCQVIVNGVYASLRYYLRLLKSPAEFIDRYVDLLKTDETIKFQHKTAWNDAVCGAI